MDPDVLAAGREAARLATRRLQLTIPSVLAAGEEFDLRIAVFAPDFLPDDDFDAEIVFGGSAGVEKLPRSVRLAKGSGGMAAVEGLRAAGAGAAVVRGDVAGTIAKVQSNPAWVFDEPPFRVYWGDLHVHSTYSNCHAWACRDPRFAYEFARGPAHLDFAAVADHLRGITSEPDRWDRLRELARAYDEPGRFVPFLAFESSHRRGFGGDNNAYYRGFDGPYFWVDRQDMRGNNPAVPLEELWRFLDGTGEACFTAPHHTGRAGKYRSFGDAVYDAQREPLFEVYSAWGSSEMRHSRFPLSGGNTDEPAYFVDALQAGCRYGVIASSDDHTTLPGGESRNWNTPLAGQGLNGYHHMGLAAVRADELTRASLWQAMVARSTFGTTFARTLVDVRLGELAMGQEARVGRRDALRKRRRIDVGLLPARHGEVHVVLMRNGEEFQRQTLPGDRPPQAVEAVAFTDADDLDAVAIREAPFHPAPFVVYYVRVEMPSLQTQWTSPIWLDL